MRDKIYSTSDLALAAAISIKFPVISITREPTDKNKFIFNFKNSLELRAVMNSYWRSELNVNPKDYFHALKELKSRIYNI